MAQQEEIAREIRKLRFFGNRTPDLGRSGFHHRSMVSYKIELRRPPPAADFFVFTFDFLVFKAGSIRDLLKNGKGFLSVKTRNEYGQAGFQAAGGPGTTIP